MIDGVKTGNACKNRKGLPGLIQESLHERSHYFGSMVEAPLSMVEAPLLSETTQKSQASLGPGQASPRAAEAHVSFR